MYDIILQQRAVKFVSSLNDLTPFYAAAINTHDTSLSETALKKRWLSSTRLTSTSSPGWSPASYKSFTWRCGDRVHTQRRASAVHNEPLEHQSHSALTNARTSQSHWFFTRFHWLSSFQSVMLRTMYMLTCVFLKCRHMTHCLFKWEYLKDIKTC